MLGRGGRRRGRRIEDPAHIEALVAEKAGARQHSATDRLAQRVPSSEAFLLKVAERGQNLGSATSQLMRLLDDHGACPLEQALQEALAKGLVAVSSVRHLVVQRAQGMTPPTPVPLDDHPRLAAVVVRPHALGDYDRLSADDEAAELTTGEEVDDGGYQVRFTEASAMLSDLSAQDGPAALRRRLHRYIKPALLVLDEIGYLAYNDRSADLRLFRVSSGSTLEVGSVPGGAHRRRGAGRGWGRDPVAVATWPVARGPPLPAGSRPAPEPDARRRDLPVVSEICLDLVAIQPLFETTPRIPTRRPLSLPEYTKSRTSTTRGRSRPSRRRTG